MGFLKNPTLGTPVGKCGDFVFRSLRGDTVIAKPPLSFRTPMDSASIARRSKFRFVIKLSSAIIRLLSIKVFWKRTALSGRAVISRLFTSAYIRINDDLDISRVKLTELTDFVPKNSEFTIGASSISLAADALGSQVEPAVEKKISLEGVVYLSSPVDLADAPYVFIPFSSEDQAVDIAAPLSFAVNFLAGDAVTFQGYTVKKVIAALVTKDAAGVPVKASMTVFN